MGQKRAIILNPLDNVANVLEEVLPGDLVEAKQGGETFSIEAIEQIPFGFKVAIRPIEAGAPVIKYGETIGIASQRITKGSLVHIHNVGGARGRGDLRSKS